MKLTQSLAVLLSLTATATVFSVGLMPAQADGFVKAIVKAPIAPDGDVVGAPADFLVLFDRDLDPSVKGYILRKGEAIRIVLPQEMKLKDGDKFPPRDLLSAPDCKPGLIRCSTAAFLQGWPQHPILPSFPPGKDRQYSMTFDTASNSLTFKADKDLDGVMFKGPGIKWAHMLLLGFHNPNEPGNYSIKAELVDATGKVKTQGSAEFKVRAKIAPSINITSVFVPGDKKGGKPPNPNTVYQKTAINQATPMPWDFLLWDGSGKPFTGVEVAQKSYNGGELKRSGETVGKFTITAPEGAIGTKLSGGPSVALPGTPVIGKTFGQPIPVGRLTARFTAGSKAGRYSTTFELDDGNKVTMYVDAAAN